jgi:HAD superfamily hydrolase (TIGR01509 family)
MIVVMIPEVEAVTFDDFLTLRYPMKQREDIIYPILTALRRKLDVNEELFLKQYFKENQLYRKRLRETLRETLLDDIIVSVLVSCGYDSQTIRGNVREAVDCGLVTRRVRWFPNARRTLAVLRSKGYRLGLISNTHWRFLPSLRKQFEGFFDVITLSYEHGHVKPHSSIFVTTLEKLRANPNQSLHVGDDPIADVEGARDVGMKTAFVKRKEVETNCDIEIERITELAAIL